MTTLLVPRAMLLLAFLAGCAGPRPSDTAVGEAPAPWGDEYEGVLADTDRLEAEFHASPRSFAADALFGDARLARTRASIGPLAGRYRESDAGRAGALEWRGPRFSAVAGALRPSLGEGAVLADARDAATVEPRGGKKLEGLRLAPSSSTWGSSLGAGARASWGALRLSLGAWRSREGSDDARAWASLGVEQRDVTVGAALGRSRAGSSAVSLHAARAASTLFVGGEVGVASDGARGVARVVAGEAGEWRAQVVAGAPSPGGDSSPASAGAIWGGAVERRMVLGNVAMRTAFSSRSRRKVAATERRQRVECWSSLRAGGARLDVGLRATRHRETEARGLLDAPASPAATDELRARVALRTSERLQPSLRVEQAYRVDVVVSGPGPPGRVVAWTGRVVWRGVDARLQASAFDLEPGQLSYAGRAALPGAATFTTLSRGGMDLSASVYLRVGFGLAVGVQGVRTPSGEERFVVLAGAAW